VTNATQAMTRSGRLDVAIALNEMAVIEIRDTGPGLPHAIRGREIFLSEAS
jgi:signal transduction histidine kinase